MNCYEWRKHITGSVSVSFQYSETGDGYTLAGSGTITHGTLYTGWTHRELQCNGMPLGEEPDWILRGPNLCEGRAQINGILTPTSTVDVTFTATGQPPVVQPWSIFWQIDANDYEVKGGTMLPVIPYPNWEDDPYSVAARAQIDASLPALRVGIAPVAPISGAPWQSGVIIQWLKDGESGTSPDGFCSAQVSCNFALA